MKKQTQTSERDERDEQQHEHDESDESDESDEWVNQVRLSADGIHWVIDECVLCGETHRHGAVDIRVATGGRSERCTGGHCATRNLPAGMTRITRPSGYLIELADGEEIPEWWFEMRGFVNHPLRQRQRRSESESESESERGAVGVPS